MTFAARSNYNGLAEAGLAKRKVPDLLIAAVAINNGLTLMHYDAAFDFIAIAELRITQAVRGLDYLRFVSPSGTNRTNLRQPPRENTYTYRCLHRLCTPRNLLAESPLWTPPQLPRRSDEIAG